MHLIKPMIFYKTGRFWLGGLFIWIVFAGYPRTYATVGDVITYGLLLIVSLLAVGSAFFVHTER
ncbi:hypothetical protein [Lactobacillus pentosus] [Lactiplantibacillus mudanjiangensis]|uniref:hypothetical protein n=1 Tax=Lactiplantibacillus mudanjiangensis TaxID=1296538 RepID=UPI0010148580|nr:hypothetical protein [Lactiplantibacillus mudanjiangensis]VDG21075.1 hypothetical protein [Lactobacillus pentosus] [Lactiplantibacillus mudanjiangensis]VDG31670.1 hypothetical protein [Lactobacillus pentosus] [Lactiplantibacillus mudanjiangensis]